MSLIFKLIAILVKLAPLLAFLTSKLAKHGSAPSPASQKESRRRTDTARAINKGLYDAMVAKWGRGDAHEKQVGSQRATAHIPDDPPPDELRQSDGFRRE